MKSNITFLFLILSFFSTTKLLACECPQYELDILDEKSYEFSDLIIIGEVIKTGSDYKIKVIEVLKGNITEQIINGTITDEKEYINSCLSLPKIKGKYLFYLNEIKKKDKKFYTYSSCSGTRLLDMSSLPVSLSSNKTKSELVKETENWIKILRDRRKR